MIPANIVFRSCYNTYAGIQLRFTCAKIMEEQGYEESTGQAKITPSYNLPCDYVIHTVGPIVQGKLTGKHADLLASCYKACLEIADANKVDSRAAVPESFGERAVGINADMAESIKDIVEEVKRK